MLRHGHGITWRFEGRELDEETRRLTVRGVETPIERKPFEVLVYLLRNPDRAVRKQELLEALWPGRILSETVLSRAVMLARQAIGDDDQQIIKTVYGYGYRLVAALDKL